MKPSTERMAAPDLSLVIACYNEAAHIEDSLPELRSVLDKSGLTYELIIIDDCSSDNTVTILQRICDGEKNITLRVHAQNVGRGGTVAEGFGLARGDVTGYLDIDLEIGPWYLLPALNKLNSEHLDGVIAHRVYKLDAHPTVLVRQWMSFGFRKLSHILLDLPLTDVAGGFKFFRRERILPILARCQSTHWFWDTELVYLADRAGLEIGEIPVLFLRRPAKESTVRMIPDTLRQLKETFALLRRSRDNGSFPSSHEGQ